MKYISLFCCLFLVSCGAVTVDPSRTVQRNCTDPKDTYNKYDADAEIACAAEQEIAFYVLSYSWAENHCRESKEKGAGQKDYLQCRKGKEKRYVLHGLWPQGEKDKAGWPRYCEGEKDQLDRNILEQYLCMTPSFSLLQHEYEKHGTCMPEGMRTAEAYLAKAYELHSQLNLPTEEMFDQPFSYEWFVDNNDGLFREAIYYSRGSKEWRICFDSRFRFMACHRKPMPKKCLKVKGFIDRQTGEKHYYLPTDSKYSEKRFDATCGDQCFDTEKKAEAAGWMKGPKQISLL